MEQLDFYMVSMVVAGILAIAVGVLIYQHIILYTWRILGPDGFLDVLRRGIIQSLIVGIPAIGFGFYAALNIASPGIIGIMEVFVFSYAICLIWAFTRKTGDPSSIQNSLNHEQLRHEKIN